MPRGSRNRFLQITSFSPLPTIAAHFHFRWNVDRLRRFSSVELLAFVVVFKFGADDGDVDGVRLRDVEKEFEILRTDLTDRKRRDVTFSGPSGDVIERSIQLLASHVQVLMVKLSFKPTGSLGSKEPQIATLWGKATGLRCGGLLIGRQGTDQ